MGHLQATGVDAAGRKQYLYHERWRVHRDRQKFERMLQFGAQLPRLRRRVAAELRGNEADRSRVTACAVRLLDLGMFRIGSEEYADRNGGLGLTTIGKRHVTISGKSIEFDYLGKGGARRVQGIDDPASAAVVAALKSRRGGGAQLLAYRDGRRWKDLRAEEVNEFLKQALGEEFSAKDFRTWNATVMAAVTVAAEGEHARSQNSRRQYVRRAIAAVAELLGNTPAVARRSYIDPRVFDLYLSGSTIAPALERIGELDVSDSRVRNRVEKAVLELLTG